MVSSDDRQRLCAEIERVVGYVSLYDEAQLRMSEPIYVYSSNACIHTYIYTNTFIPNIHCYNKYIYIYVCVFGEKTTTVLSYEPVTYTYIYIYTNCLTFVILSIEITHC